MTDLNALADHPLEPLGFLDEDAINGIIAVLSPILTQGQGMRARHNEEAARSALRAFLLRARALSTKDQSNG